MIFRPTENDALRNIRWGDIERVAITTGMEFCHIDWKYVLMTKHINFGLGSFASDIVMQIDNRDVQLIIANRLDEPEWYVVMIMNEIFNKILLREYRGLPGIPYCTPFEEVQKHRQLIGIISKKHKQLLVS